MPYASRVDQRRSQREWFRRRRAELLAGASCMHCGTAESLELHHLDPAVKSSHRITSWSRSRQREELAKCMWLCTECHLEVSRRTGVFVTRAKLTADDVLAIRAAGDRWTVDQMAAALHVQPKTVRDVLEFRTWRIIPDPAFSNPSRFADTVRSQQDLKVAA